MKRYAMLDSIRGLIIISMVIYHTVWDIVYIFGINWKWYRSEAAYYWQQSICWGFILLSGFCWSFGRRKLRRGLMVFVAGILVTVVTAIVMPSNIVLFGVLTLLGSCMLVFIPLDKCLCKCPPVMGILISFGLFILTRNVNSGGLGVGVWQIFELPDSWYANSFTTYLGFPARGFYSTDYFSLIPWIFLYTTGYYLHKMMESKKLLKYCYHFKNRLLEWIGKHSLIIYMLHQPIVYGILMIVFIGR